MRSVADVAETAAQFCANRLVRREMEAPPETFFAVVEGRFEAVPEPRAITRAAGRESSRAEALAEKHLFYASVCGAVAGARVRAGFELRPGGADDGAGRRNRGKKNSARVLTVKKSVIRFRPADAACRSE